MKRVVVTGVTGFVGRQVVAPLRARGFEVHALVRNAHTIDGAETHACDLFDRDAVDALLAEVLPTHLLHLAWSVPPGKFWTAPDNLDWVTGSLLLYRAFVAHGGKRFVGAGTCAEYDWNYDPLIENVTPCVPATLYGVAKDSLQRILMAASRGDKVSFGWGRVFFAYGPGEKQGRLTTDVVGNLLAGTPVETTLGAQLRDFMHVADVAAAFAALCDSDVEGPVNIASGEVRPLRELVATVGDIIGRRDLLRIGARSAMLGEPATIAASTARLNYEVGFRPSFNLDTGLRDMIEWWRRHNSSLKN